MDSRRSSSSSSSSSSCNPILYLLLSSIAANILVNTTGFFTTLFNMVFPEFVLLLYLALCLVAVVVHASSEQKDHDEGEKKFLASSMNEFGKVVHDQELVMHSSSNCDQEEKMRAQSDGENRVDKEKKVVEGSVDKVCEAWNNFVEESRGKFEAGLAKREEVGTLESECGGEEATTVGEGLFEDWESIERTELEKCFGAAVAFVGGKSNADQVSRLGSALKRELYGLHMVAVEGPCCKPQPMAFKLSARSNWNAWQQLGNMSPEVAMEQYIILLSKSIPGWMANNSC